MHLNKHKIELLLILLLFSLSRVAAQSEINNPYSGFGLGLVNKTSNGVLNEMGGTSYAMQNPYYINFRNPASYVCFDSLSFVADVGFSITSSTLKTTGSSQRNSYARPDYVAIGLPVTRHWRTSVGLVPFSTVGYEITNSTTLETIGDIDYTYSAEGGVNQLYWGNAFQLCKGLSIGINAAYMFGSIYNYSNTEFTESNFYNTHINNAYHLDGIYLTGGIQYFFNIKEKHRIGIGAVYSNTAYIWAKEYLLINYYENSYNSYTTYDTAYYNDQGRGNVNIPQSVGGGFSYSYNNKFLVAADVTWQNWDNYSFMGNKDSLTDAISASVGAQFIPDPLSAKYHKRMAFRFGAKYSTGDFILYNKPISEFSICVGVGFPFTTFNTHSNVNVMLEYGKLGTLSNDLIRQNYFKLSLSFTLQEKWYQRMKIE